VQFKVISIGTLARHPLWNETGAARTPHGTTVVIESDDSIILVNPSLPGPVLSARLDERCGMKPTDVTHVFLTSFQPDLRRGLPLFEEATWLISTTEREAIGVSLVEQFQQAESESETELANLVRDEIALLQRCEAAPDKLAPNVDLFPLPGHTPGTCGLILSMPRHTVLVCGDAIPTVEHLDAGQVLADCADLEQAQNSFSEAIEIADFLIPGRDNLVINRTRSPMF